MITITQTVQEVNITLTYDGIVTTLQPVLVVAESTDHDVDGGTL